MWPFLTWVVMICDSSLVSITFQLSSMIRSVSRTPDLNVHTWRTVLVPDWSLGEWGNIWMHRSSWQCTSIRWHVQPLWLPLIKFKDVIVHYNYTGMMFCFKSHHPINIAHSHKGGTSNPFYSYLVFSCHEVASSGTTNVLCVCLSHVSLNASISLYLC